jgi:vacuolar protein sorting-associated protein 8
MSSTPEEGEDGATEDTIDLPDEAPDVGGLSNCPELDDKQGSDIGDILDESEDTALVDSHERNDIGKGHDTESLVNDDGTASQRRITRDDLRSDEETISIPDDSPSIQVWRRPFWPTEYLQPQGSALSSPRSEAPSFHSPGPRASPTGLHRPFDRRFQSRLSASPLNSPRAISPAFLNSHSRQSSLVSIGFQGAPEPDPSSTPWDVVRWTKLRKITGQAFSEVGKRNFGRPTCMAITTNIVIGTSKGIVLVFDYQQNPKATIGMGTKAVECGAVTSLAISADHTTIAAGHAEGHIFTWEIARSARPFLHIPPIDVGLAQSRKTDGHVSGVAVLHVGFLGYRHTAIVSADDRGMAFSHLATRGMGAVGRTVRTTRVLGRYPDIISRGPKLRKASSVMAFSPLPLGNIEQGTDDLGLVAMMTPYLLVIVSTTPIAQTQHKSARPKEVAAHSAMSAALAWFPALKLKGEKAEVSKTKLMYCWSNVLTVLEVTVHEPSEPVDKDKPPTLEFKARSRWRGEEAIVAVQWLSRSVLAVLTITQQLLILEDISMHVADSFDLLQKHIFHADLYSQQLHGLVEQLDEEDSSMHGVVADAFHMSFRAYKGRLFLLGFNDVSIGSLSNWADRLLALMEAGDFIGAIRLATAYYTGDAEKLTIGLPEEDAARQAVVRERLLEMISASLKYAFGHNQQAGSVQLEAPQLKDLAKASISACVSVGDADFLFDEVYSWYDENNEPQVFLDELEPYIMDGQVTSLPPAAVKALIEHFMTTHTVSNLEEIICLLDTSTMDIDQVMSLCKKYNLYDAYIYVWNRTLHDYVGPLEELLSMAHASSGPNGHAHSNLESLNNAQKVFPYLSFIWTGRTYPIGVTMEHGETTLAKSQTYSFFFSGGLQAAKLSGRKEPSALQKPFPNLHKILSYDTASFMSVLNEAFEDNFLNDGSDSANAAGDEDRNLDQQRTVVNRQYIVRILLEIMTASEFEVEDTIFLDMFIARNLPKYPQYILLTGTTLHRVLVRLCRYPSDDMADDCELSVEYLLSMYHPPDMQSLIPMFQEAKFFRVLKSIFKSERQYPQLVSTYFLTHHDEDGVFATISECLEEGSSLTVKQRREVLDVIKEHARELARIDLRQAAITSDRIAPDLHDVFLLALSNDGHSQYEYLKALFDSQHLKGENLDQKSSTLVERYVQLMCQYNPSDVADFINSLKTGDLRLEEVLPSLESSGIIDAAIILLARRGQVKDAMERLIKQLDTLEAALLGILHTAEDSPDAVNTDEAVHVLLESVTKYSGVGIWLCQTQTKFAQRSRSVAKSPKRSSSARGALSFEDLLWLDLINAVVRITKNVSPPRDAQIRADDAIESSIRAVVQKVFTALLTATTSRDGSIDRNDFSFLRILRAFLTHAAATSPSLSQLRTVIASIFSAYAYEESLLSLANLMLDKDLFVHVDEVFKMRQKGWRPRGQICEVCRRRVWGPGTGTPIWEAWEAKQNTDSMKRRQPLHMTLVDQDESGRGKGKAAELKSEEFDTAAPDPGGMGPIVVFSCRHVYHRKCLGVREGSRQGTPLPEHLELACPACA